MNNNTHQNHPLIPNSQNYVLNRKIISIHSTDRDISKWKHANHFEVQLPCSLDNVQSMRLDTISIPNDQYVFSNEYQNTKLAFSLEAYDQFTYNNYNVITITEGSYTPEELVFEIETKMNKFMSTLNGAPYDGFVCQYNKVTNTFWFGNKIQFFSLRFDIKHDYGLLCPDQTIVWDWYTKWGLPSYLGYQKTIYESTKTPESWNFTTMTKINEGGVFGFDYSKEDADKYWLDGTGDTNYFVDVCHPSSPALTHLAGIQGKYGVTWCYPCNENPYCDTTGPPPPASEDEWRKKAKICNINIIGDTVIYMELDKYNTIDEIDPYSKRTTTKKCNDYHGRVNAAFAKIQLVQPSFSRIFDSRNTFLSNVSHYEPPLERLSRLKFKFRYHDGRLVDFRCQPLSFSIEFNMLRGEQAKALSVRVPAFYNL